METQDIFNSKMIKLFTKGLLVITGIFACLSYGVIFLLLHHATAELEKELCTFISIFTCIPIIVFLLVFFGFSCLVKSYYEKLYGSSDSKGIIIKLQKHEMQKYKMQKLDTLIESCLTVMKTIKPDSEKNFEVLLKKLKKIINLLSEWKSENGGFSNGGGI